jgi:hypothetical protein
MIKQIRNRFRNQVTARLAPAIGRSFIGKICPRVNRWQQWDSTKCLYFNAFNGCGNWVQHDSIQFEENRINGYVYCDSQDCKEALAEEFRQVIWRS